MTVPVPDHRRPAGDGPGVPPGSDPPGPPRPPVTHPAAPTPPRSRAGAHVLSLFAGLVLTPVGLACLAGGARAIDAARADEQDPSLAALVAVLAAAVILGIVAASAAGSAVGPLVGGLLYGLLPGTGFLLGPDDYAGVVESSFRPLAPFGVEDLLDGVLILGRTASLLMLGLTLVAVGVAAVLARAAGKRTERAEARASGHPGAAPGGPPEPPRTRRLDHLVALSLGLLVTPFAVMLLASGSAELAAAAAAGDAATPALLLGSGALGTLLLLTVVLASGWSSLGLLVAGVLWGLAPGLLGLVFPSFQTRGMGRILNELGTAIEPGSIAGLRALTTLGVLLAWGAVATFGALGVHGARVDGRRRERAEQLVRAARRQP